MTARFCTGRRIISSVIHWRAEAAAKGFSFGTVIDRGTRMSRCWKPERIIFGLVLFAGGCMLGPDFKTPRAGRRQMDRNRQRRRGLQPPRSTGIGGRRSMIPC